MTYLRPPGVARRATWPALALLTLSVALSGCRLTDLPDTSTQPTPTVPPRVLATALPTQVVRPTLAPSTPTVVSAGTSGSSAGNGSGGSTGSGGPATGNTGSAPVNGPLAEQEAAVQVVDKVGPAVVTVINTLDPSLNQGFSGQASGSGVIFNNQGYIVTNNHVVEGQAALQVIYADGTKVDAQLVGTDQVADLAVLKVAGTLPAVAQLGDSDQLKPGETVIAIGSALGDFHNTVTVGVISGLNRTLQTGQNVNMENMIQTDTAINHGNSGGPLINLRGEVIGINTAVLRSSGQGDVAEGLGFSIPSNTVKSITAQIITTGKVARPYLGISSQPMSRPIAALYNLRDENGQLLDQGVLVQDVVAGGPAESAGLRPGDVVVAINDQTIDPDNALSNVLTRFKVGEQVTLTLYRSGKKLTLPLTLSARP